MDNVFPRPLDVRLLAEENFGFGGGEMRNSSIFGRRADSPPAEERKGR